jgi:hypothetical protein
VGAASSTSGTMKPGATSKPDTSKPGTPGAPPKY